MNISKHSKHLDRENILILVSPWKTRQPFYFFIERSIPKDFGFVHYSFPREALNADPILTRKYFLEITETISRDIENLNKEKPRNIHMHGQSLGGLFCMIIADKMVVKRMVLVTPGHNMAESFWEAEDVVELRKEMKSNGIGLAELKQAWEDISPDSYFKDKALETEYLLAFTKIDKIIPYKHSLDLVAMLKDKKIKFVTKEFRFLSHVGLNVFSVLFPGEIIRFLTK